MDSENQLHGICCIIYVNSRITYFVDYMKNKEFFGEGGYYDYQWNKIYEGTFDHNKKVDLVLFGERIVQHMLGNSLMISQMKKEFYIIKIIQGLKVISLMVIQMIKDI